MAATPTPRTRPPTIATLATARCGAGWRRTWCGSSRSRTRCRPRARRARRRRSVRSRRRARLTITTSCSPVCRARCPRCGRSSTRPPRTRPSWRRWPTATTACCGPSAAWSTRAARGAGIIGVSLRRRRRNSTASRVSSMYASSSEARCAASSRTRSPALGEQGGDPLGRQPVDRRARRRPVDGDRGAGVRRARSSPRPGARCATSTRSPDAAREQRRPRVVSAISRPRPMTIRWSAVSSSSLIRWLETSTARPSAASDRSRPRIQTMPSGSSPLTGSSNISTGGSPSSARGDARAAGACRARSRRPGGAPPRPGPTWSSTSSTRARRRSRCCGPATAGGRGRGGSGAPPRRRAARRPASAACEGARTAGRRPARSPGVGRVQPEDHAHGGGLAGAVGADEAGDLAGPRR